METKCFSSKKWSKHGFHSRCLPDASRCLQRSPRCLSDASRCFPGVVRPAGGLIQVNYLASGFKKGDIYWIKNGRVVFLGKIKEYVACKQPNKKDKIPSKVTREGLKWKSDFSWKVSRNIVNMHQNRRFRWTVQNNIIKLRSFSSLRFGLGRHTRSFFTK